MASLLAMFLLAACGGGDDRAPTLPAPTAAPESQEVTAKLVDVEIRSYTFTPDAIVLKLGEPVQFNAISVDGIHTFTVKELGIDVDVSKKPRDSKVSEVFTPQRTGKFEFICRVHPVSRYLTMHGFLEITE